MSKKIDKKQTPKQPSKQTPKQSLETEERMPLTMYNYKLMLVGFVLILVGFVLMWGGKSPSPDVFNYDMFSFRRITLAPILVLAGFAFEIYAIMARPKRKE